MPRRRIHRSPRRRRGYRRRRSFGAPADALAREAQALVGRGHCTEAASLLERARAQGGGLVTDYAQQIYEETCPLSPRGTELGGLHRRHRRVRRGAPRSVGGFRRLR